MGNTNFSGIMMAAVIFSLVTATVGCGEKKTLENGTIAVTPLSEPSATCGRGMSSGGAYSQGYSNIGFQPYGAQSQYPYGPSYPTAQTGFCGCPADYQPTCDMQYGMTCAPVRGMQNFEVARWQLQGGGSFSFSGFSGYAGYENVQVGGGFPQPGFPQPGYPKNCSSQVAQTCMVGSSQCGMGRCAPMAAGSNIGICVR